MLGDESFMMVSLGPSAAWARIIRRQLPAAFGALAVLCCTMPVGAVTYIQGIDVYSGDGVVNWTTVKNGGYQFAFVKATEGVNFVDSKFAANMQNAHNAGVYVGPYHFCRVDSKNGVPFTSYNGQPFAVGSDPWLDATSEAVDFIEAIRPYYLSGSYLPPVADVEGLPDFNSTSLEKTFISNWVQLFSDTVNAALGVRPMIYTSKSGANTYYTPSVAGSHKLWEAWWKGTGTTSPPLPSDTPLWNPWTFWQWSATGSVAGVPGSGANHDCDKDVFYGTASQLTSLLVHNVPGDYNHNGVVDMGDYVVWRNTMGSTVNLGADGNGNSIIDSGDFSFWRARFGQTAGSGSSLEGFLSEGPVPEPASSVMFVVGFAMGVALRRRRD